MLRRVSASFVEKICVNREVTGNSQGAERVDPFSRRQRVCLTRLIASCRWIRRRSTSNGEKLALGTDGIWPQPIVGLRPHERRGENAVG